MIRVLLAEDQGMVRGALAALLMLEGDIEIVAQADNGTLALEQALATRPDVALLDIEMPEQDGLAVAAQIHKQIPACRILILTTFGRPGYLRRALESGAVGFLVKDAPSVQLAVAIRRAMRGERVVDPTLATSALTVGNNPLTPRERELLAQAAGGASIADIAAALFLTEGTVRNYLSVAMQKVGAQNRVEAAKIAEQNGWL